MNVAENIRRIRKEKKLTQKQLGELSGLSEAMIRQYELELRNPKLENLKKIAGAFGIYIGELLADNYYEYKEQLDEDYKKVIVNAIKNAPITMTTSYSDEREDIIEELFSQLNDIGRDKAVEQMSLLVRIPEYRGNNIIEKKVILPNKDNQ